jgi:hypothetical protein
MKNSRLRAVVKPGSHAPERQEMPWAEEERASQIRGLVNATADLASTVARAGSKNTPVKEALLVTVLRVGGQYIDNFMGVFTVPEDIDINNVAEIKVVVAGEDDWDYVFKGMTHATDLNIVAARLRISPDEAERYLIQAAAQAACETTTRAAAMPRPKLTRQQIREAKDIARLDGLLLVCQERLEEMELPESGFTTQAEADAGALLGTTWRELQKLQRKLGKPVTETPGKARLAEAMASAWRRSHDKETGKLIEPRGPGGRPRRWAQAGSPST